MPKPLYTDLEKRILELEKTNSDLKAVFNNIQQMFITIDKNKHVVSVNDIARYYIKSLLNIDVQPGSDFSKIVSGFNHKKFGKIDQ